MSKTMTSVLMTALVFATATAYAQDKPATSAPQDPSTYMHLHAPFAETLVNKVKAAHNDEIVKLGIHAVPPGEKDNVIIANITASKIGKKSSDGDMKNLATGHPVAKKLDKDKTYDLLIPLTDAEGRDLDGGFVVMEVPFNKAGNEEEAIKIGVAIRDDLQKQIPSKMALYQ